MMSDLGAERERLAERLADCDRGAFPGSRAWREENEAIMALAAFDAAHPEVIQAVAAEHAASVMPADVQS